MPSLKLCGARQPSNHPTLQPSNHPTFQPSNL
ncbi:MAG: PT domain-containing protein [Saprospiraceae bacterium]|nr:PT domain-containing protein [Saprospiraceae bacterium]